MPYRLIGKRDIIPSNLVSVRNSIHFKFISKVLILLYISLFQKLRESNMDIGRMYTPVSAVLKGQPIDATLKVDTEW